MITYNSINKPETSADVVIYLQVYLNYPHNFDHVEFYLILL